MKRPWDAVVWWEIRRIPFNLFVLVMGLVSGLISAFVGSHLFRSDADFGSPFLGAIAYVVAANLCYTLGWITEIMWAWGDTSRTEKMRHKIFAFGLIFSASVTLLPAIVLSLVWAAHGLR